MKSQEFFYAARPQNINVSKKEFELFIKSYPRKLIRDVSGISIPPTVTFNDFELANRWPYSIVASTHLYSDNPNDYCYASPEEQTYLIMENYIDVFNSKTGNKE